MPYDPGIVDRSGEIRAEGTWNAGKSLNEGLAKGLEAARQQREENRAYQEKVAELELFVRTNADKLGLDTEQKVAETLAPKKREAIKDRYQRLSMFVQTTLIARTLEAKAQRQAAAATVAKNRPAKAMAPAQTQYAPLIPGLGEHRITDNIRDGGLIVMEDKSVWEVDPLSRLDVTLWLPFEEVLVVRANRAVPPYSYLLVNKDQGQSVPARYVGQRQPDAK